jgi:beta-galactosidase
VYSGTGWPTLDIPAREVVPVSGAYPDGFWSGAEGPLPPSGVFLFNTSRSIGEMGNVGGTPATEQIDKRHYPFFLAEAGGGMHVSYHRRPVVSADDLVATCLVQIGSGANLYGYYMYHGGTNPGRGLQETQDSGYPNDVPVLGYDFRAPLGQYGQRRESYGRLRTLHLFLAAFGAELAPLDAALPADAPVDPSDLERPRVSVRGAGASGFVFVNNHVRHYPMPDFDGLRLRVEGTAGAFELPPLRVPAGASFILPVGQRIGGARLRHATLQPLTRLVADGRRVWVLFADGVNVPQLNFEAASVGAFDVPQGWLSAVGDEIVLRPVLADAPCWIHFTDDRGDRQSLLLLTSTLARQAHVLPLLGRDRLVLCEHGLHAQDDATLVLQAPHDADVALRVFPGHGVRGELVDEFAQVVRHASAHAFEPVRFEVTHDEQRAPAIRLGPVVSWRGKSVPQAPGDAEFEQSTRLALTIDARVAPADGRLLVEIDYIGDAARLYADDVLVDDHFYDGEPWIVGLDRHARAGAWPRFELRILAARADLPVFLEDAARRRLQDAPRPADLCAARTTLWRSSPLNFSLDAAAVDNNE